MKLYHLVVLLSILSYTACQRSMSSESVDKRDNYDTDDLKMVTFEEYSVLLAIREEAYIQSCIERYPSITESILGNTGNFASSEMGRKVISRGKQKQIYSHNKLKSGSYSFRVCVNPAGIPVLSMVSNFTPGREDNVLFYQRRVMNYRFEAVAPVDSLCMECCNMTIDIENYKGLK